MPRKPTCECGVCPRCLNRAANKRFWDSKTPEERREIIARRDAERVRARDRARHQKRKHDPEYKRKRAARRAVYLQIKQGGMTRGSCEVCGAPNAQAHHEDYDRPLDVRWLCSTHHAEVHA